MEQIDVSAQFVLGSLKAVVEKCLSEEKFESRGVVEAAKLLGNYLGLWEEKSSSKITGDGIVVAFNMVVDGKKT